MTNVSPVERLYQFERASTESDDMAAQILYLTQNMRRLQNDIEQFETADTIKASSLFQGTFGVQRSDNQEIPNNAWTALEFDRGIGDPADGRNSLTWTSASNTTRLSITKNGGVAIFHFNGAITWSTNSSGIRSVRIENSEGAVRESAQLQTNNPAAGTFIVPFSMDFDGTSPTTYYMVKVYQNSGAALNATGIVWAARSR